MLNAHSAIYRQQSVEGSKIQLHTLRRLTYPECGIQLVVSSVPYVEIPFLFNHCFVLTLIFSPSIWQRGKKKFIILTLKNPYRVILSLRMLSLNNFAFLGGSCSGEKLQQAKQLLLTCIPQFHGYKFSFMHARERVSKV